jgi:hypothetical protein
MPAVVKASAAGSEYPLVAPEQLDAVLSCAGQYGILDQPEPTLVVAELSPQGGLQAWMATQLEQGRGLVLQMPDVAQIPAEMRPSRSGVDLFCQPDPDFLMAPALLSTRSLNEALGFLSGAGSVVVAEPRGGWVELGSALQQMVGRVGWAGLAAGGAVVALAAAWALRR